MRMKRTAMGLLLGLAMILCGCGDDTEATLYVVKMEELAIPAGTQPPGTEPAADTAADLPENTPEPSPEPETISITISAAGDAALGNYHTQDYYYSFRHTYDEAEDDSYFLGNVWDIFSQDDMSIVNLEGPLTDSEIFREGQPYCIKGDSRYVGILTSGSVEAVSFANNHRMDYGEKGVSDTIMALEQEGIAYAYDSNVGIYETKGIRIGIVSVNELGGGRSVERLIQEGIGKLQEQEADLIITCCHWGVELDNYPESYQKELGRKCIDWGADLVLGHHPHVLQGMEEYQGKYIVYSLANFCFGANRNPDDKDTMIFQQTFTFTEGKKQEETSVQVIPCLISSVKTRNDFRPTPAQGEDKQRIIDRLNEYSMEFGVSFDENGYLLGAKERFTQARGAGEGG